MIGLPNYTVGNQAPTITSSVTNGEKKMEQKPSPVSSTPTTKKVKAISNFKNNNCYFENIVTFKVVLYIEFNLSNLFLL